MTKRKQESEEEEEDESPAEEEPPPLKPGGGGRRRSKLLDSNLEPGEACDLKTLLKKTALNRVRPSFISRVLLSRVLYVGGLYFPPSVDN